MSSREGAPAAAGGVASGPGQAKGQAAGSGPSRLARLNAAMRKRSAGAQVLLSEHVQALWSRPQAAHAP